MFRALHTENVLGIFKRIWLTIHILSIGKPSLHCTI